tara:strand:+ start:890 stop:5359 length:4470 start_codon:yes stop_codon:yes gene_type:complete
MKIERSFVRGRMNKSVDERLLPQGEYVDAMNIRLGSTEESEIGAIENARGNELIAEVKYSGQALSSKAVCLGSLEDSENETIYWCVHDPANAPSATNKVDLIVSYDTTNDVLIYHVISTDDGGGVSTALNFSKTYRVNAMTFIDGLLFFTDNNNQPMRINVDRVYNEPSVNDLLVIVQPPSESPTVSLQTIPGGENYMDTRFISFAYRYKYRDGEYSALSQFSEIAFDPKPFDLSTDNYQNEGMVNEFNSAAIGINTGDENVTEIDVVFKLSNQSVINVIERFNKESQGWQDNQTYTINFNNRKIYTTLGTNEILRAFDNVPRKAQAQTIMGNRLMYGNYVDGYDIVDSDGNDCSMLYTLGLTSDEMFATALPTSFNSFDFTIDPAVTRTVAEGQVDIDCSGIASNLVQGAEINFAIKVSSDGFSGAGSPTSQTSDFNISFTVVLDQPYADITNLVASTVFTEALQGVTIPTDLTQCGTITQGISITDQFNCTIQPPSSSTITWNKDMSSTNTTPGIPITATVVSTTTIRITLLAMRFVDAAVPGQYAYEYFTAEVANAEFDLLSNKKSLHSDRDYEVGIVYMDEFNRSTTALVSNNNTLFVPPGASTTKNSIEVTIPPNQKPPSWATRYKFVVKPSSIDYEVIYSDLFFKDPTNNSVYFKLEGDNQTKAAKGDRLRVKKDTGGALSQRIETVILDIESQPANFITGNLSPTGSEFDEPGGLYMRTKPIGYSTEYGSGVFLGLTQSQISNLPNATFGQAERLAATPQVNYQCSQGNPNFDSSQNPSAANPRYIPIEIPANSRVVFDIIFKRERQNNSCGQNIYRFQKTFFASADYNSLEEFVTNEDIDFNSGDNDPGNTEGPNQNLYYPGVIPFTVPPINNINPIASKNQYRFVEYLGSGASGVLQYGNRFFQIRSGTLPCGAILPANVEQSSITANIRIYSSENLMIFETTPVESDANIYYEGSDSYAITNGNHMSGGSTGDIDQDIAGGVSGEVNLSFFNCFTFGNGAESYKIRDGLATPSFRLGERVTAVSEQDFKEAHRFADITYSGLYNEDTNVNRLNEFNLGVANFKELEKSFGPIRVLDARQTDILTLQEDKISYVLSSKTLLSSPSGGGNIAAVPQVLGNQVARIEKYGISSNPESFVSWGFDKFFTDAKRGVVLQLKGSGQQEQLNVISETGMGSWFRDYFILTPNTQKLGGYDPYMNEYVVSGNLTKLPVDLVKVNCGLTYDVRGTTEPTTTWEVLLGEATGVSTVNWTASLRSGTATITFNVTYNGVVYTSGATSANSGSFVFDKNIGGVNTAQVEVIVSEGVADFSVNVGCPVTTTLNITKVCLNSNNNSGKYIHNEYYWTQGAYDSPTSSDLVLLQAQDNSPLNFAISEYDTISGPSGRGTLPPIPSVGNPVTIRIQSSQIGFDTFVFDPAIHTLRYYLSATPYANTPTDMNTLFGLSTNLTPLVNPTRGIYYFDINYVQTGAFKPYLYLIYEYIT